MGSADGASRFIETTAAGLRDVAVTRRAEANQLLRGLTGPLGGQVFRWLRTGADAARIEAQAEALKQLGREIKMRKSKRK